MKTRFAIVAASLLALTACGSFNSFTRADRDGDGRVSGDEAAGSEELQAVFSSADSNRNGFLDRTEFEHAEQLIAGWKAAHDEGGGHAGGAGAHSH